MRPTIHTLYTPTALAAWHAVERALRALGAATRQWHERRCSHAALTELSDRTLRDLGIDRSEIVSYARLPIDSERARVYLSAHGRP